MISTREKSRDPRLQLSAGASRFDVSSQERQGLALVPLPSCLSGGVTKPQGLDSAAQWTRAAASAGSIVYIALRVVRLQRVLNSVGGCSFTVA